MLGRLDLPTATTSRSPCSCCAASMIHHTNRGGPVRSKTVDTANPIPPVAVPDWRATRLPGVESRRRSNESATGGVLPLYRIGVCSCTSSGASRGPDVRAIWRSPALIGPHCEVGIADPATATNRGSGGGPHGVWRTDTRARLAEPSGRHPVSDEPSRRTKHPAGAGVANRPCPDRAMPTLPYVGSCPGAPHPPRPKYSVTTSLQKWRHSCSLVNDYAAAARNPLPHNDLSNGKAASQPARFWEWFPTPGWT